MKLARLLVALIFAVSLMGGMAQAFTSDRTKCDFDEYFPPMEVAQGHYFDLQGTFVEIVVFGQAEGDIPNFDVRPNSEGRFPYTILTGPFAQGGTGIYVGNGYVITAAHVILPKLVTIQESKSVYYITEIHKVLSKFIMVGNRAFEGTVSAEVVWVNEEYDLAILKIPTWNPAEPLKYKMANTFNRYYNEVYDSLKEGTVIGTIVRARNEDGNKGWAYEWRFGTVVSPKPVLPGNDPSTDFLPWFNLNDFTMNLEIYPGDSGSPVFAFEENGTPVLIGVARAAGCSVEWKGCDQGHWHRIVECYSWASRIDPIKHMLESLK